jgi:hypothetical protein
LFNGLGTQELPEAVNQRVPARGVMPLSRSGSDLRNRRNLRLPLPLPLPLPLLLPLLLLLPWAVAVDPGSWPDVSVMGAPDPAASATSASSLVMKAVAAAPMPG